MSDYTALVRTKLAPNALQLAATTATTATTSQLHAHAATASATTSGNFNKLNFVNGSSSTRDVRALLRSYAGGSRWLCSKDSFVQGAKELIAGLVPQEVLTVVRAHQVATLCIYFVVYLYAVTARLYCMLSSVRYAGAIDAVAVLLCVMPLCAVLALSMHLRCCCMLCGSALCWRISSLALLISDVHLA
jgi:hypothetical protein